MSEVLLFIFEGEVAERKLFESFRKYFIENDNCIIIEASYKTNIYALFSLLKKDPDLDIAAYLIEKMNHNRFTREQVSEVHLFFDLDSHAPEYLHHGPDQVDELLEHFDNETENGKLYISYPMVEAIMHVNNRCDFKNTISRVDLGRRYKDLAKAESENQYRLMPRISRRNWYILVKEHCIKANYIVTPNSSEFPTEVICQKEIFSAQKSQHLNTNVAVLSAFPLMLLEYYGAEKLKAMIEKNLQKRRKGKKH